jgi:RNA polymerase sigma factor (sigma-70 family)
MRITTNLCHNWKRSVGRYLAALQHVLQREPPLNTHIQQAEEQLDSELLWRAVQRLPVEDQKVIYLRYFLDCSEMETAQVLGVAQGTVKSRQHRALARLRGVLEKEFPQGLKEGADVF